MAVVVALLMGVSAWAAPPASGGGAVQKERLEEALARAEAGLKANPGDAALLEAKVDALLGLGRTLEARQTAVAGLSKSPGLRYRAGICEARFGRMKEAVVAWRPLLADPTLAPEAFYASFQALVASGRIREAEALFSEAESKLPYLPPALVGLAFRLGLAPADLPKKLKAWSEKDPADADFFSTLSQVCGAADGPLMAVSSAGKMPLEMTVKERSERIETSSLTWGPVSGGPIAGSQVTQGPTGVLNPSSGSQSYGSGVKDKATTEGQKTGTISVAPRPVVEVALNGSKKEPFVLDSAAGAVLLAQRMAKNLDLKPLGTGEFRLPGMEAPRVAQWVLIKEMAVGPMTFKNVPALVMDEASEFWKDTGGVLPLWLFREYAVRYDRRHSTLALYPSGTTAEAAMGTGSFPVKSLWLDGRLFAETRIQDQPFRFCLLDTTLGGTYLEERHIDTLGASLKTSRYGSQSERGLVGIIQSGVADNVSVTLGPTRIQMPTILVGSLFPDDAVECSGVVGRNLLDLFEVYFDCQAGVLALKGYERPR